MSSTLNPFYMHNIHPAVSSSAVMSEAQYLETVKPGLFSGGMQACTLTALYFTVFELKLH